MSDTIINIVLKLNAGDAAHIIDQLKGKINNLNGNNNISILTFDNFATKIGFRLPGISNIIDALRGTFGDWIKESNAGEAAQAKLAQALKNQSIYSETLIK